MIISDDGQVLALLRGACPPEVPPHEYAPLRDALQSLEAAWSPADTLIIGERVLRVITGRRRRYYLDVGGSLWIFFEWRVHDAIEVRLVKLGRRGT